MGNKKKSKGREFKCTQCDRQFSYKSNLLAHIKVVHQKLLPYKCEFENCNKSYPSINRLRIHMRTHFNDKRYECEICKKRFNEKVNLKTHMAVHSNEKPYECKLCGKTYKSNTHLKEHIDIIHLQIK